MSVVHLDELPLGPEVSLLVRDDNGLAALSKPEGILSQPANDGKDTSRTLLAASYDETEECYHWKTPAGETRRIWLINRLDSATSGLIMAATSGALAREVRAQFQRRQISKAYMALVFGAPRKPEETWRDVLNVRKFAGHIRTIAGSGNLPAESRMALVRTGQAARRVSLIKLEPHTGRSHQLRVQCAKRGLPIVGDRTYGNFPANREFSRAGGPKRMFLHSMSVAFDYEFNGRKNSFAAVAPLPPEFEQFE